MRPGLTYRKQRVEERRRRRREKKVNRLLTKRSSTLQPTRGDVVVLDEVDET